MTLRDFIDNLELYAFTYSDDVQIFTTGHEDITHTREPLLEYDEQENIIIIYGFTKE